VWPLLVKLEDGAPQPKELVAPKPKSWFVRQKVLGANNHEIEGFFERNVARLFSRAFVLERSQSVELPFTTGLIIATAFSVNKFFSKNPFFSRKGD